MTIFTFSEARQKFARMLDLASEDGEVFIRRKDGTAFVIRPVEKNGSPLDVEGVKLSLSVDEIVEAIHETRTR